MQPTVGRIVHYYEAGDPAPNGEPLPQARAAIVVEASPFGIDLMVLHYEYENGMKLVTFPSECSLPKAGHWSWPPRGDAPSIQGGGMVTGPQEVTITGVLAINPQEES